MPATPAPMPTVRDILARLIAFDTVSSNPNRALVDWVAALLKGAGIDSLLVPDASGGKANLYATVGPAGGGGVMLSGHTDVVPVEGQAWTRPPFELTEGEGRLYGRGTADMKGFVACAIGAMLQAARAGVKVPLHLALSYDEEVGCIGVRRLLADVAARGVKPLGCIVGEPTGMELVVAHKGKKSWRCRVRGHEAHSSLTPRGVNAVQIACELSLIHI